MCVFVCVCTHAGVTEPVVGPGVGQVETVLAQQQLVELEAEDVQEFRERREEPAGQLAWTRASQSPHGTCR